MGDLDSRVRGWGTRLARAPTPRKNLYFNTDMTLQDLVNAFDIVTPITNESGIVKNAPSLFGRFVSSVADFFGTEDTKTHIQILQSIDTYFKSYNMYIEPLQASARCDSSEGVSQDILGNNSYYLSIDFGGRYTTYNVSFKGDATNVISNFTMTPGWVTRFLTENIPNITHYLSNYNSLIQALGQHFYREFMMGLPTQEIVLYFIIKPVGEGDFIIEINRNGCDGSSIKIASTIPPRRQFTGGVNKMKRIREKRSRMKRCRKKRTWMKRSRKKRNHKKRTWKKRNHKKRSRKKRTCKGRN